MWNSERPLCLWDVCDASISWVLLRYRWQTTRRSTAFQSWSLQPCCNEHNNVYYRFKNRLTMWKRELQQFRVLSTCTWSLVSQSLDQMSKVPHCLSYILEKLAFPHIPIRKLLLGTKWQNCTNDLRKSCCGRLLQTRRASHSTVPSPHKAILSLQLYEAGRCSFAALRWFREHIHAGQEARIEWRQDDM